MTVTVKVKGKETVITTVKVIMTVTVRDCGNYNKSERKSDNDSGSYCDSESESDSGNDSSSERGSGSNIDSEIEWQ